MVAEKPEWKELGATAGMKHEGYVTGVALGRAVCRAGAMTQPHLVERERSSRFAKIAAHAKWSAA